MANEAEVALVLKAKNLASKEVDKLRGSFSNLGGTLRTLGKVGILAVLTGIAGLAAGLTEATKRAAEEQVGIRRLDAALRANVAGFNGNTDAIEKVIAKREQLAFSDDELRSSLTFLVTKYQDVTKAQDIQSVAMDVARLKNISLEEATALVSKGMDGNSKVLKQLGLDLPATATEQERLTAIQQKAAGQAEAYGQTAAGGQKAFQIAMDDLLEDVGTAFLPIMAEFFRMLTNNVIPAIRDVIGRVSDWYAQNKPMIDQIVHFSTEVLGFLIEVIGNVIGRLGDIINWIASNKTIMNGLKALFQGIADTIGFVVDALKQVVRWAEKAIGWLTNIRVPDLGGFLPDFHTGGVVPGPRGAPSLAVVHGGEKVTSPGPVGGAGVGGGPGGGAPVEIPIIVDGRELARVVDRRLFFAARASSPI